MTNRFLLSVAAAALIAGTGFANAQGTGRMGPSGGSDAQQSAPAANTPSSPGESSDTGRAKPGMNKSDMNKSENNGMSRESGTDQHAQQNVNGDKSTSSETNDRSKMDKNMKAEGRDSNGTKAGDQKAEEHNGMKPDSKSAAEGKSSTTTGQAAAHAKMSTEQRTRITTVIKNQHIRPEANVNFSVSIGTHVPREVHFHTLPTEIVTVYPEWRGYEFFLVRDQIIVVDPRSLEIVAVLDA